MSGASATVRYAGIAILLHWALAILMLGQLGFGWALDGLPPASRFAAYQLHKSIGILILVLTLARIIARVTLPRPGPATESKPAHALATLVHAGLYGVMLAGPLTGWALVSTAKMKLPTLLFGIIPLPHLPLGPAWHEPAEWLHGMLAWLLAGLVALHVAGALHHHLRRDDIVARMLPAALARHAVLTPALVAMLLAGGLAFAAGRWGPAATPVESAAAPTAATPIQATKPAPAPVPAPAPETAARPTPTPDADAPDSEQPVRRWQVQPGGTIGFATEYSGEAIKGRFSRWTADIRFSPDDLAGSSISVTIDLASVSTGDDQRDGTLTGDDFFAVAARPTATWRATRIRRSGDGYVADGTLTLNGVSRPVPLRFSLMIDGDRAKTSGSASVLRLAHGVGQGQWSDPATIPDAVAVTFRFEARADAR
ncbi:YceI family protein [Sphingomonas sp. FW199]|uniref:YceI family protein n=1 Tax=Sphingomonas sp. FW199 TaxID=3400217 RepID=UPI003CEA367E